MYTIHLGDSYDILGTFTEDSIDAVVTDPPYGLNFMGKEWDKISPAFDPQFWIEVRRILKPGGHILSFGGTRTFHRMTIALEDAGFEIRDCLSWLYGSGFPKSLDVSKAIDKAAGAKREVIGPRVYADGTAGHWGVSDKYAQDAHTKSLTAGTAKVDTAPATPEAEQWAGWGTALKPAWEPIIVARKPLIGTVAANVLAHGTGALNIDGTRIGTEAITINTFDDGAKPFGGGAGHPYTSRESKGRWPANVALDEAAAEQHEWSRYFYCAKASRSERNAGLDGMPERAHVALNTQNGALSDPRMNRPQERRPQANVHPTVKPIALMRWLVRMVTPPGGLVLDPFAGSGSTGCAAVLEGVNFIGIEKEASYAAIAERRIAHWLSQIAV